MQNITDLLGMRSPRHVATFLAVVAALVVAFGFAIIQIAPSYDSSPIGTTSESIDVNDDLESWQQSLGNGNGAAPLPDDPELSYTDGPTNAPCDPLDPTQACPYDYGSPCKGACDSDSNSLDPLMQRPRNESALLKFRGTWHATATVRNNEGRPLYSVPATARFNCSAWFASPQGHIGTAGHCASDPIQGQKAFDRQYPNGYTPKDGMIGTNPAPATPPTSSTGSNTSYDNLVLTAEVRQSVYTPGAIVTTWTPVKQIDVMPLADGDFALFKVDGLPSDRINYFDMARTPIALREYATVLGFASGVPSCYDLIDQTSVGQCDDDREMATTLPTSIDARQPVGGPIMLQMHDPLEAGMSGGPVLNNRDQVVGVVSGSSSNGHLNYATDLDDVRSLLARNNIIPSDAESALVQRLTEQDAQIIELRNKDTDLQKQINGLNSRVHPLEDERRDRSWYDNALGWIFFLLAAMFVVGALLWWNIRRRQNDFNEAIRILGVLLHGDDDNVGLVGRVDSHIGNDAIHTPGQELDRLRAAFEAHRDDASHLEDPAVTEDDDPDGPRNT